MPTDKLELERRISLTTADDQVRGFNFGAVLDLVEQHAGASVAARMREPLGKRVLGFFNYPAADFLRLTYAAADALEPTFGSVDAAFREMGQASANALLASTVGKTLMNFLKGTPPDQLIRHTPTAYGMSVSYGTRTVTSLDAQSAKLIFKNDLMPAPFHVGVIISGMASVGLRANVEGMSTSLDSSELMVRWS